MQDVTRISEHAWLIREPDGTERIVRTSLSSVRAIEDAVRRLEPTLRRLAER